ncbi:MAG: glycosyltransferase, partial [Phycisphaerales bacterium]
MAASVPGPVGGLAFIQFGDYAEAYERLSRGGEETYYAQRQSVDFVTELRRRVPRVLVMWVGGRAAPRTLDTGVETVGFEVYGRDSIGAGTDYLKGWGATHAVLRTPIAGMLADCVARGVRVLPTFADSFATRGLRRRAANWRLARLLNHRSIDFVGNHHVNASLNLAQIGVRPGKIIPWDFFMMASPGEFAAKRHPGAGRPWRIAVVGRIEPDKGLPDCIAAVELLAQRGVEAELHIVGGVKAADFGPAAAPPSANGRVVFRGPLRHRGVLELMHGCDTVVVPSRHGYPEGLPLSIYDAYCSRTPLVASDHPMFDRRVVHGESGLVFPATDAGALADRIAALHGDPALFERLSRNSEAAWNGLQLPVEWSELVRRWAEGTPEDMAWLRRHTLASGRYDHLTGKVRTIELSLPEQELGPAEGAGA